MICDPRVNCCMGRYVLTPNNKYSYRKISTCRDYNSSKMMNISLQEVRNICERCEQCEYNSKTNKCSIKRIKPSMTNQVKHGQVQLFRGPKGGTFYISRGYKRYV